MTARATPTLDCSHRRALCRAISRKRLLDATRIARHAQRDGASRRLAAPRHERSYWPARPALTFATSATTAHRARCHGEYFGNYPPARYYARPFMRTPRAYKQF